MKIEFSLNNYRKMNKTSYKPGSFWLLPTVNIVWAPHRISLAFKWIFYSLLVKFSPKTENAQVLPQSTLGKYFTNGQTLREAKRSSSSN